MWVLCRIRQSTHMHLLQWELHAVCETTGCPHCGIRTGNARLSGCPGTPAVPCQRVVQLPLPFPGQEPRDLGAAGDELVAVTSEGVLGVGERPGRGPQRPDR